MPLCVSLLGPPVIEVDGRPLDVDTRKATALLAYLAVTARPVRRDTLTGLLWPETGPDRARATLRRTLSTLKSALDGRWLAVERDTVGLAGEDVWFDLDELRGLVASTRDHGHGANAVCPRCLEPLLQASELERGPFLEGFSLRDSVAFDDWLQLTGDEIRRELAVVLDRLCDAQFAVGDHSGAVAVARKRLALDPLHEPAHRQLISAYAAAGERLAALEQYRECVRVLDRELGVRPLDETTALYHSILDGSVQRATTEPEHDPPSDPGRERAAYPLVGREAELAQLRRSLDEVGVSGRVVAISGEVGIGKSRLIEAFTADATARGHVVVASRCFSEEVEIAFGVVGSLLRAALVVRPEAAGGWWADEAARLLPALGAAPGEPLDTAGAQARFFEAIAELLAQAVSGPVPGIVVVDDVQWADESSLSLLAYLGNRLEAHGLLLLLAWRNDEIDTRHRGPRLLADARRTRRGALQELRRLTESEVAELVHATGRDGELGTRLHKETGGVPFFVVEYLDALARGGDEWSVPSGVRELVQSRLSSVGELATQVVAAASVVGGALDSDVLRDASGRTEEEVVEALDELVARGILVETADGSCEFRHDQTRELVYESLTRARRRLLHRRTAEALAARSRSDAQPAALARHLELAGDDAAAAALHRQAGDAARALFANVEALGHYTTALSLGDPDVAELHAAIGDLETLAGDYGAALASYESAAAHASQEALPTIEHRIGLLHLRRGEWELADASLGSALSRLPERDAARALADRSLVAHRTGRTADAGRLAREALQLAEATADDRALAQVRNILGMLADGAGDTDGAVTELERSLTCARAATDRAAEVAALNNLALVTARAGDTGRGLALTREALDACISLGDRHREAALRNNLADLLRRDGQVEESMEELKRAVAIFAEIGEEGRLEPEIWKLSDW